MGLVPRGRGPHDIAASLRIPQNVSHALQIAATGECFPVDLGILNKRKVASRPSALQSCAHMCLQDLSTGLQYAIGPACCNPPGMTIASRGSCMTHLSLHIAVVRHTTSRLPVTGVHESGQHWPCCGV